MRERLDCAILRFSDVGTWSGDIEGVFARGRLFLHRLCHSGSKPDDVHALAELATRLQRFDACVIAVCEANLAWVRQALLAANPHLRVPVIGLLRNLTAPAISDLYNLGMADFIREPMCAEELRIRIERHLRAPQAARHGQAANAEAPLTPAYKVRDASRSYSSRAHAMVSGLVNVPSDNLEQAAASDPVPLRQEFVTLLDDAALVAAKLCVVSDESFAGFKARAVQRVEQAYLRACLTKSSGNIALASRIAKKHRRAFWALMRKHDIDAAPFRNGSHTNY